MSGDRVRVVYVAGAGRSGSTLLGMLLGALPGTAAVGELRHIWKRGVQENQLCGCGRPFHDCPFWHDVGVRAFGGWQAAPTQRMIELHRRVDRFRRLPALAAGGLAPRTHANVKEYAQVYGRLYRAVSEAAGGAAVVDTGKSVAFAAMIGRHSDLDLRVLHLVRDPRAVAYSWMRLRAMPEVHGEEAFMARFGPLQSSLVWLGNNAAADALRLIRLPVTDLRYELLVGGSREQALAPIADCVGQPPSAVSLLAADEIRVGVQHTVAGNPSRFANGSIRLRADEEWRTGMRTGDRRVVSAVTFPLLLRYGYRPVNSRRPG
ncbi:MAG: sulfotransferase [Gaiellales bacterium]